MAEGWICIHRKIRECDIWDYDEPFTRRDAWIDLLLLANHHDKDTIFDGKRITIKRGQYLTSVRKLSKEWHWGKDKTLKYLRLLEQCEMIIREADSRRTLITIVNYSIYQDKNNDIADSSKDSKQTVSRQLSATNNNDNNDNNENNNKYICAFDVFWKIYPRKNDKARAYKCYQARLKDGYTEDQLLTACKNYAAECEKNKTEQKYIKHGATFLSVNEPFIDYLEGEANGRNNAGDYIDDEERRNREIDEYLASDEYRNNDEHPFA